MQALLEGADVGNAEPLVDWLYAEQPTQNLWRKPIEPMVALVRELSARGVRVAALSNSEGGLAELLAEIELAPLFEAIIDSQVVGVAKPQPRIFEIALERLGIRAPQLAVHVGDSWAADVEGALAAGWKPIWYRSRAGRPSSAASVPIAADAGEVRIALTSLGVAL
jgi:HAD superfamily hydrolase (TIGR01509 family)